MSALTTRSVFEGLVEAKRAREKASSKIENLSLDLLSRPDEAVQKINGSAVDRAGPMHIPDMDRHQTLENLTGFGTFDPVKAASSESEAARQRKLRRDIRVAQIKAGVDTEVTIGEVSGYRTLCCYRLVRELARIKEQIGAEEALSDTDIFNAPQYVSSGVKSVDWENVGSEPIYRARQKTLEPIRETIVELEGYLEDPIPYEPPENPDLLEAFVFVMEDISDSMFIHRGSSVLPDYGILGLKGLFSDRLAPLIWPSRHELITLESFLIEEVIRVFVERGEIQARKHLITKYGFMQHEATEVMHLAIRKTKDRTIADQEIARAKMILRIEHVIQEAGESCDIRAQLTGLRLLGDIQGLRNEMEDDSVDSLVSVIRDLKAKREARELEASEVDLIE